MPFVAIELCRTSRCVERARLNVGFLPESQAVLGVDAPKHAIPPLELPQVFAIGAPIQAELDWSGEGFVQVRLNSGAPQRLPLPFIPEVVRILSGSADVTVKDVDIR